MDWLRVLGPAVGVLVGALIAGLRRGERGHRLAVTASFGAAGGGIAFLVGWLLAAYLPT